MSLQSTSNTPFSEALPLPSNQTPLLTLVWLKGNGCEQDARRIVENMLRHSSGPYGRTAITGGDAQLAWSVLLPHNFAPLTCWSIYVNGSELCLVEGDMHDDLPGLKLVPGDNPGLASRVAAHMRPQPGRRFTDLVGVYSGIYVDRSRSCASIFGDITGTRSVFWLSDAQRFVVTGNLWAFRGCDGFSASLDKMALSQMLLLGFPLRGRTWMDGVRQLQRGRQVLSFSDGRTKISMLDQPIVRQNWSFDKSVRILRENLDETVARICRRLGKPVALALSGGLDSRTLLASLHSQKIAHRNFTFCLDSDEADNQLARASSALLGDEHESAVLNSPVPINHIDFSLINEGESPGFGYMLLAAMTQQYSNALMIGSEAVRQDTGASFRPLSFNSKRALAWRMLEKYSNILSRDQLSRLISDSCRVAWQDFLDEWFDSFDQIEQESVMDVYLDHMVDYRVQRRTRPRLEQVRWYCLPLYPFMDDRLYKTYRSLSASYLQDEQATLALLRSYKTGLEKLPSAARRFGMSIVSEYRYRHLIYLAHLANDKVAQPLQRTFQTAQGALGLGKSCLSATRDAELCRLNQCELFHGSAIKNMLENARRGKFVNREAISRLINAGVINDFIFGSGFAGERSPRFIAMHREINFIRESLG